MISYEECVYGMPCCDTVPLNLPLQQTCRITACKKVALVIERRFGSQALRKQSVAVAVRNHDCTAVGTTAWDPFSRLGRADMILSHSKMRVYVLLHLFVDYGNLSEPPAPIAHRAHESSQSTQRS